MMRRVYFGGTAVGKTRICMDIAKKCEKNNLKVISNIPSINSKVILRDPCKVKQLCKSRILRRLYEGSSMEEFPNYNYSPATMSQVQNILNYIVSQGDVLILDDIDAFIPYALIDEIMHCLSEDGYLADVWKHVFVVGYCWHLRYLIANKEEDEDDEDIDVHTGIFFIKENGDINEAMNFDELQEMYSEVVYGK